MERERVYHTLNGGNLLSRQVSSALQGPYINGKDIWSKDPSNRIYQGRRIELCKVHISMARSTYTSYSLKSHQRFSIRKDGRQWKLEPGGV